MPVVTYRGSLPTKIAEGSRPGDWVGNLGLGGDLSRLVGIETTGPDAAFFAVSWNAVLGTATVTPGAVLDFEAFSAAGVLPRAEFGLRFRFNDGSHADTATPFGVSVLDRDDTAPTGLAFVSGGTVAAGAIGATIGTLAVSDPDSAGPFSFTFPDYDSWRFEVVDGVLKLRDGITLGWDDIPFRPILIEVSDGTQSAAFSLQVTVTEPSYDQALYTPPVLAPGETRFGVSLAGPREALTTRPATEATHVASHPGGLQQLLFDTGEAVSLGPELDRIRFSDGSLGAAADGPAAHAAAMHRAILGADADGTDLAPLVASLRAGTGWREVAADLLDAAPTLAALDDAAFVHALAEAALGTAPGAEALALHAARLASANASRAQVAVDIALSPQSITRLAADAPAGHWVAEAFDDAANQPSRPFFEDVTPPMIIPAGSGTAWFM